jgi:hypothetical protein
LFFSALVLFLLCVWRKMPASAIAVATAAGSCPCCVWWGVGGHVMSATCPEGAVQGEAMQEVREVDMSWEKWTCLGQKPYITHARLHHHPTPPSLPASLRTSVNGQCESHH